MANENERHRAAEEMECPQCGATDGFRPADVEPSGSGGLMLLLGGLLPYLLYRSKQSGDRLYCTHCHCVFKPADKAEKRGMAIILISLALLVVVLAIVTRR